MRDTTRPPTTAIVLLAGDKIDAERMGALPQDALVIAADAGVHIARGLGLVIDVVVGDMDSLSAADLARLESDGVIIQQHPTDKDYSDAELALRYAADTGVARIVLVGGGGGRLDHQLATIATMFIDALRGVAVEARLADSAAHAVRSGERVEITTNPGAIVGLIPFGGDAGGVTTEGLQWPLNDETLHVAASRGISNRAISHTFSVEVTTGQLVVTVDTHHEGSID